MNFWFSGFRLAVVLGLVFAGSSWAQSSEYDRVLYQSMGDEQPRIRFVPKTLLHSGVDSVGLAVDVPNEQLSSLFDTIEARRRLGPGCGPSPIEQRYNQHPVPGQTGTSPAPASLTVAAVLEASPVSIVGTIEATRVGWDFAGFRVSTLVFVRVEEVIKDDSATISVGELVVHIQPWGSMQLSGVILCTEPPKGVENVKPSSSLGTSSARRLAMGSLLPANENVLMADQASFLPIEGQEVQPPQPASRYFEFVQEPVALRRLREIAQAQSSGGQ